MADHRPRRRLIDYLLKTFSVKKSDFLLILFVVVLFLPFFLSETLYQFYHTATKSHGYLMAFVKFGILATLGDMMGLRILQGRYNYKGYGIVARAVIWGLFGIWIAAAMKLFSAGAPVMLESFGVQGVVSAMAGGLTLEKLLGAFFISFMMNTLFAPVFMTTHKITDTHILDNGGSLMAFLRPIPVKRIITSLNWGVQWGFVFKKTIPFFWIPAHTITFMLPSTWQVLFAALVSVVLGILLSVAAVMSRK